MQNSEQSQTAQNGGLTCTVKASKLVIGVAISGTTEIEFDTANQYACFGPFNNITFDFPDRINIGYIGAGIFGQVNIRPDKTIQIGYTGSNIPNQTTLYLDRTFVR